MSVSLGEALGEDYRRVGPVVPFSEVKVGYDDVVPLRDLVRDRFFPVATTQTASINLASSSCAGALLLRSYGRAETEEPNFSLAAKLTHYVEDGTWGLVARVGKFGGESLRGDKLMLYRVGTDGREVKVAAKAVGFVLQQAEIRVTDVDAEEAITLQRLMYEKPMDAGDCHRLAWLFERSARRAPYKFPVL